MKENKQQMENLQQGIEALNVDIGGGEQSDVSYYIIHTSRDCDDVILEFYIRLSINLFRLFIHRICDFTPTKIRSQENEIKIFVKV